MPAETARAVWSIGVAIVLAGTANLAVYAVLTANQAAGVYPPEADTIIIPIFESFATTLINLVLVVVGLLCSLARRWLAFVGWVLMLMSVLLVETFALAWAVPDHYFISGSFAVLALHSAYLIYRATGVYRTRRYSTLSG